jgi:hypothetical protein
MIIPILTTIILTFDAYTSWLNVQKLEDPNNKEYTLYDDIDNKELVTKIVIAMMYIFGIGAVLSMFFTKAVLITMAVLYFLFSIVTFRFPVLLRLITYSSFLFLL